MSVLFTVPFLDVPIHVLYLRGRTAFIARELGAAAGYSDDGQPFLDLICQDWPASLEDDDHIATVTGKELAAIKREVELPEGTSALLVLFAQGALITLLRSRTKHAKRLIGFLLRLLARAEAYAAGEPIPGDTGGDDQGGAPVAPQPVLPPAPAVVATTTIPNLLPTIEQMRGLTTDMRAMLRELADLFDRHYEAAELQADQNRRLLAFEVLRNLAFNLRTLELVSNEQWAALEVEAVEELLDRPLRSPIPRFGFGDSDAPLVA